MANKFHVDLGGIVDLLGRHLYSTPRVYLRELVQNGVDALAARQSRHGGAGADEFVMTVIPADVSEDGRLCVTDTGIGLSRADIETVLSTVGQSSKRDELGFARQGFLGRFGIGLLSCFLVTDEIELITRAVGSDETLCWRGRSDGTFTVDLADEPRSWPGTEVRLAPRPGQEVLLGADLVESMARSYASHLPQRIVLRTNDGDVEIANHQFPWNDSELVGPARRTAAMDLCRRELGFSPLDVIALSETGSGTQGYAFIPPMSTGRSAHRVYARNMLVAEQERNILPEWAFFVRAVLNTDQLNLTASREALQDDEELATVRERLGEKLRRWLLRTAQTNPARMREILEVHHVGMRAMAVEDEAMLDLVATFLAFESTVGTAPLNDLLAAGTTLHYCDTEGDYRQVAQIARAQRLAVVNACHTYDVAILQALQQARPEVAIAQLSPQDVVGFLADADPSDQRLFTALTTAAEEILTPTDVRPELRAFEPASVPVLLLSSRSEAVRGVENDLTDDLAGGGDMWAQVVSSLQQQLPSHPRLVINTNNADMRRLASAGTPELLSLAIQALYAHALASGQHRPTPYDLTVQNRALPELLKWTLDSQEKR